MKKSFVSLYSGCGGMDIGFLEAGFTCAGAFDVDPAVIANYRHNIGPHIYAEDILLARNAIYDLARNVDVLVAGPPCQGFSTAGKNDPDDARNAHIINVAEIAAVSRPKAVIIENVRGLLGKKYSYYWQTALKLLRDAGYTVQWAVYDASNYGVAQARQRVLLIASLRGEIGQPTPQARRIVLSDALKNVSSQKNHDPKFLEIGSDHYRIAQRIGPGQKLSNVRGGSASIHTWNVPEVYGEVSQLEETFLNEFIRLRRRKRIRSFGDADPLSLQQISTHFSSSIIPTVESLIEKKYLRKVACKIDITNAFNGKYRRLHWDKPSLTVDTRFGQPRHFLHPTEHRGFTVREAARLQGFPDSYEFVSSQAANFRMIGNAVPVPMARSIAETIKNSMSSR